MYSKYYLNKTALVTGGGSGMGRGLCQKLAECGALVICTDINLENAEETARLIGGGTVIAKRLDVTRPEDFEEVIAGIVTEHGRLDLIFNNAGMGISGELRDFTLKHWKK